LKLHFASFKAGYRMIKIYPPVIGGFEYCGMTGSKHAKFMNGSLGKSTG
jgi:hypothetical protein